MGHSSALMVIFPAELSADPLWRNAREDWRTEHSSAKPVASILLTVHHLYRRHHDRLDLDKALVQRLVRRRIKDRYLPLGRAVGVREIFGDGRRCDACNEPITPREKLIMAMVSLEWRSVCFHADCYEIWDGERRAIFNDGSR